MAAAGFNPTPFVPVHPGWHLNPNTGHLSFFTADTVRVYRATPPMCWYRDIYSPKWRGCVHGNDFEIADLIAAGNELERRQTQDRQLRRPIRPWPGFVSKQGFLNRLDPECVELSAGQRQDSWLMYCALWRAPQLRSLAHDNPALALLLIDRQGDFRDRCRRIRRLSKLKRHDLLHALCQTRSRAWVRVFGRVSAQQASLHTARELATLVRSHPHGGKHLWHLPRINRAVAELAHWCPQHVHPNLLHDVALGGPEQDRALANLGYGLRSLVGDTVQLLAQQGRPAPCFRSLDELAHVHGEAAAWLASRGDLLDLKFGQPPIPETRDIIGLRSSRALVEEAQQQGNCLASAHFARRCQSGQLYVYRVTSPERATVAIGCGVDGRWFVEEAKARFNAPVSTRTKGILSHWLAGAGCERQTTLSAPSPCLSAPSP